MTSARDLPARLAAALSVAGHPDITAAAAMATPTVRADLTDGSAVYFKVAHVGPAAERAPARPSWPGHTATSGGAR